MKLIETSSRINQLQCKYIQLEHYHRKFQYHFMILKPSAIFGQYIGQSEQRTEDFFNEAIGIFTYNYLNDS